MTDENSHGPERDYLDIEFTDTATDPCRPLEMHVEVLENQIAVLEEGLPGAPGAQKTALAKEINHYRELLDESRAKLRACRGASS